MELLVIDEAIVLAAGRATRMRSSLNKVLEPLAGRPMIHHVLEAVRELGVPAPVVVVGHQAAAVRKAAGGLAGLFPIFVGQANPAGGTGDAVAAAAPYLAGELAAVLYGDMPFVRAATVYRLGVDVAAKQAVLGLIGTPIEPSSLFGRIVRTGQGDVAAIVEWKNASRSERQITEGNLGVYVFRTAWLVRALPALVPNSVTGEVYLTDLVDLAVRGGQRVIAAAASEPREALGVNTPEELLAARRAV